MTIWVTVRVGGRRAGIGFRSPARWPDYFAGTILRRSIKPPRLKVLLIAPLMVLDVSGPIVSNTIWSPPIADSIT